MNNVDRLKNLYDAFGRGHIPTVLGAMDPDIRWYQAESNPYIPNGEPWVGPDAVLNNLFMKLGAEWDGFSVHPRRSSRTSWQPGKDEVVLTRWPRPPRGQRPSAVKINAHHHGG